MDYILVSMHGLSIVVVIVVVSVSSFNPLMAYHFLFDNKLCCDCNQKFDFDHSFVSILLAVGSFRHVGLKLKHSGLFQSLYTSLNSVRRSLPFLELLTTQ